MRNSDIVFAMLGIPGTVPLSERAMARGLKVTFYPPHKDSGRLIEFAARLDNALRQSGAQVIPFEDAIIRDDKVRVKPGIVIIEQGEGGNDKLAINHVSDLYQNPVVGIYEGPPPIPDNASLQQILDSIVGVLAWNLAHIPVFVEEKKWTICTMNGAVIECEDWNNPAADVLDSMVPKLAAQVVPPKRNEIIYREGVLDAEERGYSKYINDFMSSAKVWRDNGLMLAHTSIEDLKYRNRFYKRIVSRYLDHRTGMSYGFMVWQLPVNVKPAIEMNSASSNLKNHDWDKHPVVEVNGHTFVNINLLGKSWIVEMPDVWVLSTRSGCNKTDLNPEKDILRLGLCGKNVTLETPRNISKAKCRPSYDTYVILAHAAGNVIAASLQLAIDSASPFPEVLREHGLSISHWHGYPDHEFPLEGYVRYGEDNPPVSCSTPQTAAYAFAGKLMAIEKYLKENDNYRGDIHVEPHHGTNITGCMSLTESALWVDKMHKNLMVNDVVS